MEYRDLYYFYLYGITYEFMYLHFHLMDKLWRLRYEIIVMTVLVIW